MDWSIEIAPLVPAALLWFLGCLSVLTVIAMGLARMPSTFLRAGVLTAVFAVLLNPVIREEVREPVPDIAAVIIDRSDSLKIADRDASLETARAELVAKLEKIENLEVRIVDAASAQTPTRGNKDAGTELFTDTMAALSDIAPDRLAGLIILSDGQIHDLEAASDFPFDAPIHAVLAGDPSGFDRKIIVTDPPKFGIVGQEVTLRLKVVDDGEAPSANPSSAAHIARVTIEVHGTTKQTHFFYIGDEHDIAIPIDHGGDNLIEVRTEPLAGEMTLANNVAVIRTQGVRDRLRVLLVTGEPHAGERTWRNLLKADPAVDLVHFTILRPPEKQDGTPTNELSLIAFPTRELFAQKLKEFDLVIFDRYRRRNVLPIIYLHNIARYVENGGALLAAVGPSFASPYSLYRTPLAGVLPARPSGQINEVGFQPRVSDRGHRHPVTANLPGANLPNDLNDDPEWGRWFRAIGVDKLDGETVMEGPDGAPLLILDHVGDGRIAQLLSDHAWLWTRGYEGGGPQAELLRRLAHWLMREPELEDEDLSATVANDAITISRRTMAEAATPAQITLPDGSTVEVPLTETTPGLFEGTLKTTDLGLYRIENGSHSTLAVFGSLNAREFEDVRSTEEILSPLVRNSGGKTYWLTKTGTPDVRHLPAHRQMGGKGWLGLKQNNAYVVTDTSQSELIKGLLAALILLASFIGLWLREAR